MLPQNLIHTLYPLGLVANFFFGTAFILQWWKNKLYKNSFIPKIFWKLSSVGAVMMIFHGFIQNQYPIALLHAINLVIYFRNLNIVSSHAISFQKTLTIIITSPILVLLFFLISSYLDPTTQWMASPDVLCLDYSPISIYWHLLGNFGLFVFSARFLFQWYHIEQGHPSEIPEIFWQMSLLGSLLSLTYFIRLGDPVNVLSYGCGLFPPLANLYLLYRNRYLKPYSSNHYFLSSGEPSGDILGSNFMQALTSLDSSITYSGIGGPLMRAQGLVPLIKSEEFHVSGFIEIFLAFFSLFRNYRKTLKAILKEKPGTVVCIDFQDFHAVLIRSLRKKGYKGKIFQYVCPTIWAWRPKRKQALEKYLDALFVILPFEKELFSDSSLKTVYLGHPLVDIIENHQHNPSWKKELSLSHRPIIAAFPGSRRGDIERNLRVQVQAFLFSSLAQTHQLLVSSSNPKNDFIIKKILEEENCRYSGIVPATLRYELMQACDCALAKCGTIVLETALNKTPTIVTCRLHSLDTLIAKHIFKIFPPAYSLPNIIMKSVVFPEFIGGKEDFDYKGVAAALEILMQGNHREQQVVACRQLCNTMKTGVISIQEFHNLFYKIPEQRSFFKSCVQTSN
ncbi:lipid-A-disaccharide synthase N-terminal domain-containing protein [Chlamydia sp. 17-3921]|uniref:lipid-A-disaccharide synthase N-terminal domain-containing protein n=1 Tax=Chlamydia sp. 17-3921 TaxID=2675798 RepID=UPI00191896F5|nr:lipid-A-disaccharide synthase N-terminal domain-containing protein [Chlamydia sp. 17-3921]